MISFIVGLFIGGSVGVFTMALLAASRDYRTEEEKPMLQKDYVVTIDVLDRTVHKIIVRTTSDVAAVRLAKAVIKSANTLTEKEFEHITCSVALFTDLDNKEFFVCF